MNRLFAVLLEGPAKGCHTALHDMLSFVVEHFFSNRPLSRTLCLY
jgi:hypothetical protein